MPLSDLIAALAAATGPSRELDERVAVEVFGWKPLDYAAVNEAYFAEDFSGVERVADAPAYTSSLDAITGALEQRWPGVIWSVDNDGACSACLDILQPTFTRAEADAASPSLALCLAAARLAAREAGDE